MCWLSCYATHRLQSFSAAAAAARPNLINHRSWQIFLTTHKGMKHCMMSPSKDGEDWSHFWCCSWAGSSWFKLPFKNLIFSLVHRVRKLILIILFFAETDYEKTPFNEGQSRDCILSSPELDVVSRQQPLVASWRSSWFHLTIENHFRNSFSGSLDDRSPTAAALHRRRRRRRCLSSFLFCREGTRWN